MLLPISQHRKIVHRINTATLQTKQTPITVLQITNHLISKVLKDRRDIRMTQVVKVHQNILRNKLFESVVYFKN